MSILTKKENTIADYVKTNSKNIASFFKDESDYVNLSSAVYETFLWHGESAVLAYCFCDSELHFLINNQDDASSVEIVNEILTKYGRYFFNKYKINLLSEFNVNSSKIVSAKELLSVSKLIHKTPCDWLNNPNSSTRAFLYDDAPDFLDKTFITDVYGSTAEYYNYLLKN